MPPLVIDSGPADETWIAREIEAGWSIFEDRTVNAVDEPCVVEVIYSARRSRNDVWNPLRKVRIPPYTEVQRQAGFDLPRVGRIPVDVDLVRLMLIRLPLE